MWLEHAVLFTVGETCVKRQNFRVAQIALAERVGGIADLTLAAHKDQNVARALIAQFVNGVENCLQLVALGILRLLHDRAIAHFYRIGTTGNFNNRCVIEMF